MHVHFAIQSTFERRMPKHSQLVSEWNFFGGCSHSRSFRKKQRQEIVDEVCGGRPRYVR